ncbi:MAG: prepilin-type N-terminal cleavage/methylation domain-containing protein [Phycisphaeraceae bacterium]|nr:MAG: prepilin-type N-terminal cleavage/methylation domain-containing protein [Phycisphaeraceae bacterium]
MKRAARGFSLVEMLVALTISATLLAATFSALNASFKSYKRTTESASTHVVTRIVMHRIMTMIRTGEAGSFGPFPDNPIELPTITSNSIEFVVNGRTIDETQIVRIERRDAPEDSPDGPFELWLQLTTVRDGIEIEQQERPLLVGIVDAVFTLEYDVGPSLRRATVDLTVRPNDLQDAAVGANLDTPSIRMVASASPRNE